MWSLIDGRHIVSVLHHDGLLVNRIDDGLDKEIDGTKRNSQQAVELSQTAMQIVSNQPAPSNGGPIVGHAGYADLLLLTKAGDVETNPGQTTTNKRVWVCDICYIQMHVRM